MSDDVAPGCPVAKNSGENEERRRMLQAWVDYLDNLRDGGVKVVALGQAKQFTG